jgi:hypothetical protein
MSKRAPDPSTALARSGSTLYKPDAFPCGAGSNCQPRPDTKGMSYGPSWAHYFGGYQDRLLGGPLGLPGLRYTAPDGVEHKDYGGKVLG